MGAHPNTSVPPPHTQIGACTHMICAHALAHKNISLYSSIEVRNEARHKFDKTFRKELTKLHKSFPPMRHANTDLRFFSSVELGNGNGARNKQA